MITFPCHKCGKNFSTEDAYAGQETVCPSCGSPITVPRPEAAPPPPALDAAGEEKPCPYCGERIKAAAVVCRFCKTKLDAPPQAAASPPLLAPPPPPKKSSNMVLWIILGIFGAIALVCVVGVVLVFAFGKEAIKEALHQQCRENLYQLHSSLTAYENENESVPSSRGSGFWMEIAEYAGSTDLMICPGGAFKGREIGYRGPVKPWEEIPQEGVIACDLLGNHKDGVMVLLKSGRVDFAEEGSELYDRALEETQE